MNMFDKYRLPMRGGEGIGGAAPGGGAPPAGGQSQPAPGGGGLPNGGAPPGVVAPWAANTNGMWSIGDKPWFETVPEGPARELMSQKQYKNPAEVALAYYNINKEFSADTRTSIPGEGATPDDWNNFYTKKGRPATPDLYPDEIFAPPQGQEAAPAMTKFAKSMAHKLGLSPTEAKTMAGEWNTFALADRQAQVLAEQAKNDAAVEAVRTKHGAEWESAVADGKRAYQALGLDRELGDAIDKAAGAAPVMELLIRLGKGMREGGAGGLKGSGANPGNVNDVNSLTPAQAKAEIERLGSDESFQKRYTTANDPGHAAAAKHMEALYARAG